MCLEAPGATGDVERRVIDRFREFDHDGAWVFEEPYDVASEGAGWLLAFTKPPGAVQEVMPDGSSNRWRRGGEMGTVNIVGDESVRAPEMTLTLCAGNVARDCLNTQLLILSVVRLVLSWSSCPV